MVIQLHNPDAPATKKQLWLLHILTKTDTRNLNITMKAASDRINELKSNPGNPGNGKKRGDKAAADYRISGIKNIPIPEREVLQGDNPPGITDIEKITAHFNENAYAIGREKAGNDTATIDFYDFNCTRCFFGKSGNCIPSWRDAGRVTCAGIVESISFSCCNFESVEYSITEYCYRPKGKQCHRKKIANKCLLCNYRKNKFRFDYSNRAAWANYIPTIPERIKRNESIEQSNNVLELLNKIIEK